MMRCPLLQWRNANHRSELSSPAVVAHGDGELMDRPSYYPLLASGESAEQLESATHELVECLERSSDEDLAPVSASSLTQVNALARYRRFLLAQDTEGARGALRHPSPGAVLSSDLVARGASLCFLLPGVGEVRGVADLYHANDMFRAHVDQICDTARAEEGVDPRQMLLAEVSSPGSEDTVRGADVLSRLRSDGNDVTVEPPSTAHARVFVVAYALARTWMEIGVRPRALIGHSLGEYVAACLAGVFPPGRALSLVIRRAHMIEQLPRGRMLAAAVPPHQARLYLDDGLSLAATNAPRLSVFAGPTQQVRSLEEWLVARGVTCRYLPTTHAFHSAMMEPIRDRLARLVLEAGPRPPTLPYVSNVTGTWIRPEEATDGAYWARHLCSTVRFVEGLRTLLRDAPTLLLEVGPSQALTTFTNQHLFSRPERNGPVAFSSVQRSPYWRSELTSWVHAVGRCWVAGSPVDWSAISPVVARMRSLEGRVQR
jgi:phthiocerol/phenolphthiocerol synthesis type-I polyketide synthase E